jgi:hypothetical protein
MAHSQRPRGNSLLRVLAAVVLTVNMTVNLTPSISLQAGRPG